MSLRDTWDVLARHDPIDATCSGFQGSLEDFLDYGRSEVERHLGDIELSPKARVLDVGCGPGRLTRALCERFTKVDGVDISPVMAELARENAPKAKIHALDSPEALPFADDTFGLTVSLLTLQHCSHDTARALLAEMVRVTSGTLIVQCTFDTWNRLTPADFSHLDARMEETSGDGWVSHTYWANV